MDFQTVNKGLKIERAARCTEYEAPQVDLWFVVPNGVSECLGVSCLFVLQSKSFIISMQLAADATIYGRFKHFSKVTIKIFSSTFNKKQHKSFFFGVFCFLRLAASVCPSVSLPFRVSFIFIRAFENFHTDSFKGDESVPSDM